MHNPEVGRMLAMDPVRSIELEPWRTDPYSYAFNSPVTFNDPTGRYPVDASGAPVFDEQVCYSCGVLPVHSVPTYEEQLARNLAPLIPILGITLWEPTPAEEIAIGGVAVGVAGYTACQFYCDDAIDAVGDAVGSIGTLFASGSDARSLDDPESLEGATVEEVKDLIPDDWGKKPPRTGEAGIRAFKPGTGDSDGVRIMEGNPKARDPFHRGPRVIINKGGQQWRIPLKGNPVLGD